MSFKHSNAVREINTGEFDSSTQRFIMIELAHLADNAGLLRHSQAEIAALTILSRVTIANETKKLEEKGFIERKGYGQYRITVKPSADALRKPEKQKEGEEAEPREYDINTLQGWLKDKQADGDIYVAEYQEFNETCQLRIYEGETLPEFVSEAIKQDRLRYCWPEESETGVKSRVYAICFNF